MGRPPPTPSWGVATFHSCSLPTTVGSYAVSASDATSGDTGFTPASTTIGVTPGTASQLAFATPPAAVVVGQQFTLSVRVQDGYGNTVTSGTGSDDALEVSGTTLTCTGGTEVTAVAGIASFTGCQLTAPPSVTLTAIDTTSGDTGIFHATAVVTVGLAMTMTSVASTANPGVIGAPVTYTARVAVTAPGGGTPTGTVDFKEGGTTIAGCGARLVITRSASCAVTYEVLGTYTITAVYSGSSQYEPSSSTILVQAFTTGSLTLSQVSTVINGTTVRLSPVILNGLSQEAAGNLHTIQVHDNRGTKEGWTVTAQMQSNLLNTTAHGDPTHTEIPARNLTWQPSVGTGSSTGVVAGPDAALSTSTAAILCAAPTGYGQGESSCSAALHLMVPPDVTHGTYTAVADIVVS